MKHGALRNFSVGLAMLAAVGLAMALTPRSRMAEQAPDIDLDAMIPARFGDWQQEEVIASLVISPDVQSQLNKIYGQTLTRTYRNTANARVMLSIAYGSDQSYSTQVHRPEMCYPAQGFEVGNMTKGFIDIGDAKLPVMKLLATLGPRVEPITYWVMIGDSVARGNFEQHLARLRYGLSGKVPYGLVVRASTISANEAESYLVEEAFLQDMLQAVSPEYRWILTGMAS
jgi:EpsI family protein